MLDKHFSNLQLDWDYRNLHDTWPAGRDTKYLLKRLGDEIVRETARGASGRVLEVAAAEALHACRLAEQGLSCVVLEPSAVMLEMARDNMTARHVTLRLVRGICETLPFRDRSFDRVLCDSAIDHLAVAELGVEEMARVLAPDGRLIVSAVNYAGLSVRTSRLLYAVGRILRLAPRDRKLYWDTPVPIEHNFECSYPVLARLLGPHLELERLFGVSIGLMVPGWSALLARLSDTSGDRLLRWLDRIARRLPRAADVQISVWRHRAGPRPVPRRNADRLQLAPTDLVYPRNVEREIMHWSEPTLGDVLQTYTRASARHYNTALTGDPERSWLDDLVTRGPFRDAAVLGCDEVPLEADWLAARGSVRLDVYELSPVVIRRRRAELAGFGRRARFRRADLNVVCLPAAAYDVIWSSGSLHHVLELEHLLAEVERALRPGGLFALHDYVGEPRMRFAPRRLARINAVLAGVPARFRRGGVATITAPLPMDLSPFCAVRSDQILDLARARFEVVHLSLSGALAPLDLYVDLPSIEAEAPDILAYIEAAEAEALRDPSLTPCEAYAVFRRRP